MQKPGDKIRVRRVPKRGHYDFETVAQILDKEYMCHMGFVHADTPMVIPTLYGRDGEYLYLHGSTASRMMKTIGEGMEVCCTVTRLNGLVLARSAFHHSANYESVVIFGKAELVNDKEEKLRALKVVSDHIIDGRWEEVRQPSDKELKATAVLKLPISEYSAKIRSGGPGDDKPDYELDYWAGVVPYTRKKHEAIPDELLREGIEVPESVRRYVAGK